MLLLCDNKCVSPNNVFLLLIYNAKMLTYLAKNYIYCVGTVERSINTCCHEHTESSDRAHSAHSIIYKVYTFTPMLLYVSDFSITKYFQDEVGLHLFLSFI